MIVGGLVIGPNQNLAADILDNAVGIIGDLGHDGAESFLGFGEIAIVKRITTLAFSPVGDDQDCKSFVLRGPDVVKPFGIALIFVDEFVLGLRGTHTVEIDSVKNVLGRELVG